MLRAPPAQADVPAVDLSYHAASACPDAAAFLAAVRAQTPNLRPAPPGTPARKLAVTIRITPTQLEGRLRIEEIDGATSNRDVAAARCDDLVSALALVTALAVDAGPPSPVAPPPPPTVPPPEPPATLPPATPGRWEAGAHVAAFGALAPGTTSGIESFVDRSQWDRSGPAYSFRAAFALAGSPTSMNAGGAASFRWTGARLGVCPLALLAASFTVRPCAGLDLGVLRGQGEGLARPRAQARAWIAATLAARAQWTLAGALVLELDGGLAFPFIRDRFVFTRPSADVTRRRRWGASRRRGSACYSGEGHRFRDRIGDPGAWGRR